MNRFIKIRITEEDVTLEAIARRARAIKIQPDSGRGFELESATRSRLVMRWFEKVVTKRNIDGGLFGISTYEEIKIVTFGFIFNASAKDLILVDPPLGKHRVLAVLRLLFNTGKFLFLPVDVSKTVSSLLQIEDLKVIGVETEPVAVKPNILLSMTASGYGDVIKYVANNHPQRKFTLKAAQIESQMRSGGSARITVFATGLVRFSDEVSYDDIEMFAERIVFLQQIAE